MRGQFYDVFLDQNGGFYGYKHGAKPLHLQLNLNDSTVCLVNQTYQEEKDLKVNAELFDIHGKPISIDNYTASIASNSISLLRKISAQSIHEDVCFLRLKLLNNSNQQLDENFYWLAKPGKSFEKLNELKQVVLAAEYNGKSVEISNPGNETAFFIRLKVVDEKTGELVLPVFMNDNYFTLLPGEKRRIRIDTSLLSPEARQKSILLVTEGWNVERKSVKLE